MAFLTYDKFESFKKPVNMKIIHFINEFERLYNKIKKYEMELPTGALAYRLLKSVVISQDKHQLATATLPSLTYDWMKKQLKAIYDNISQENNLSSVKVEPALETSGCNGTNRQIDGYYWSNSRQNSKYCGCHDRFGRDEAEYGSGNSNIHCLLM